MNELVVNGQEISFEVVADQAFTTSLDIANVFNKLHKNIIAKIESLPKDNFHLLNFKPSANIRQNGAFEKETKYYKISRDGFSLLVMSFTGEKAYQWKIDYINAFNYMEKKLREKESLALPKSYSEALIELAHKVQETERLNQKIESDKPLVSFASALQISDDCVLIREWAKELNNSGEISLGQNRAYDWLREKGFLMKDNQPYQKYIDNGYFKVSTTLITGSSSTYQRFTPKITGKGQVALSKMIIEDFKRA